MARRTALTPRAKPSSRTLPFEPEAFKAPAGWKGKTVLAELFTGSECPPCVGADIAFDALIESIPAKYLAVLVYHLPIPRPDPMINPATAGAAESLRRQQHADGRHRRNRARPSAAGAEERPGANTPSTGA